MGESQASVDLLTQHRNWFQCVFNKYEFRCGDICMEDQPDCVHVPEVWVVVGWFEEAERLVYKVAYRIFQFKRKFLTRNKINETVFFTL